MSDRARTAVVVAGVVALVLVLWSGPGILGSARLVNVATLALTFSVAVAGLGILYGDAGQMSVAHGALWGVGAYTAGLTARDWGLSFWTSLPLAMVAAAAAALIIGYPSLRVRGHYFLIVTFAFAELFRMLVANLSDYTGGNRGMLVLEPIDAPVIGRVDTVDDFYFLSVGLVLLSLAVCWWIKRSSFGASLRVVRENETLAQSLGLDVARYKLTAFAISGALAGAAGVLYAYLVKSIQPDLFGAFVGIEMVLALLLGGARLLIGPLVGALLLYFPPEYIELDPVSTELAYGAVLIAVVLVAPSGLAALVVQARRRLAPRVRPVEGRAEA